MSATPVFGRRLAGGGADFEWLPADGARPVQGDLATLAVACKGHALVILVDSARVRLAEADVPTRSAAQLVQALPFALEDELAQDPEDVQVFAGPRLASGLRVAAVTDRGWLAAERAALADAGLDQVSLVPEVYALPTGQDHGALFVDGDRLLFRSAPHAGGVLHVSAADDGVSGSLPGDLLGACGSWTVFAPVAGSPFERDERVHAADGDAWSLLAMAREHLRLEQAVVLAEDGARARSGGAWQTRWPRLAAVAVLGAVLGLGGAKAWHARSLEQAAAHLEGQASARFRALFPDVRRIVDVRAQARQAFANLESARVESSAFLPALHRVGELSVADNAVLRLTGLDYSRGALTVSLDAPDLDAIERCRRALEGHVASVTLLSAEAADGQVAARLQINTE